LDELVILRANAFEDHSGDDQALRKLRLKQPSPVALTQIGAFTSSTATAIAEKRHFVYYASESDARPQGNTRRKVIKPVLEVVSYTGFFVVAL
jgi:hypothetical protein